jgi:hypothetical protein
VGWTLLSAAFDLGVAPGVPSFPFLQRVEPLTA